MGLDLIDIVMQIETHFNIEITDSDWDQIIIKEGKKSDIYVGDLNKLVQSKLPNRRLDIPLDNNISCYVCSYSLKGLLPSGNCPECGAEYDMNNSWPAVRHITSLTSGVSFDKITPETRLYADLGIDG